MSILYDVSNCADYKTVYPNLVIRWTILNLLALKRMTLEHPGEDSLLILERKLYLRFSIFNLLC